MEPITVIESPAVPLLYSDIDTDQIIPSRYITSRTTEEFAHALFAGRRADDPSFVLNRPAMEGRSILLAGRNFGCGSSREQAVWALQAGGFSAVVAPSLGEIFQNNALKNGLLAVYIDPRIHAELVRAVSDEPGTTVVVDLENVEVRARGGDITAPFEIDPFYRTLLLEGIQELDYLLRLTPEIEAYEAGPSMNPVVAARIAAAGHNESGAVEA